MVTTKNREIDFQALCEHSRCYEGTIFDCVTIFNTVSKAKKEQFCRCYATLGEHLRKLSRQFIARLAEKFFFACFGLLLLDEGRQMDKF